MEYFEPLSVPKTEKPKDTFTPEEQQTQRWLLLGVLGLGTFFTWQWHHGTEQMPGVAIAYSGFWLVYLLLFHLLRGKHQRQHWLCWVMEGGAVLLMGFAVLQAWYGSSRGLFGLALLNFLAIPILLMLHAQWHSFQPPEDRQGRGGIFLFFYVFFVQPSVCIGAYFKTAFGVLGRGFGKGSGKVWLGLLFGIPILLLAGGLLISADAVMHNMASGLFRGGWLGRLMGWVVPILLCSMVFYSFLYRGYWRKDTPYHPAVLTKRCSAVTPSVVICMLLILYLVFTYVQFVYLFGGAGLPEGLTYAEYAHEGFGQLIWVAGINFTIAAFCVTFAEDTPYLKWLLLGLFAATGVIIVSAFVRIGMYIGAYGLTLKRVMVVWLLIFLTACMLGGAAKLFKKSLPLFRLVLAGAIVWYLALNLFDLLGLYQS